MTTHKYQAGQSFPIDPARVTGVRIDGSPGVTPVDSGSARVVKAAGDSWLEWDSSGLRHAVSTRHIAELVSADPPEDVIVLRDEGDDEALEQLLSPWHAGAGSEPPGAR